MLNTRDIFNIFLDKYEKSEFRTIGNAVQQSKTLEIQNAHFEVDKCWIVREPNYDYYEREKEWYLSQSLNVNDIPGETPKMWKACATPEGLINSNYGWCIYSEENCKQFENCMQHLLDDPHTREAIMIYNRPSMQQDYNKGGMHDFMCTFSTQLFLNEDDMGYGKKLDYIVNMRSSDLVFGFNNDVLWHREVQKRMSNDLSKYFNEQVIPGDIIWNAGSAHVCERHFKHLIK